ncbi:MAG: hypothetical protein JWM28_3773, partial [Chitinophagaceae bacterium]|nr:hypothetical protein [Chitinophagaceae bacterium]
MEVCRTFELDILMPMESETINLSAQENSEIELSEKKLKYSGLIKECLASNPGQAFIEVNEFGSLVESEVEPNTRRKFSRYENAYISRLIEEATYLEEVPKKVEGYYSFIAQVPFYLYGIDSIRERSAGLMLYDKAKVVINTNNEEGLYISIDGVPEHEGANWAGAKALRGEFVSANYVNEYFYIPKIEQSEDPLETLKQFEADKEKRNSFIASARDMMKGFAKRYNELFATELA